GITPVLTGDYSSTYGRLLEKFRIRVGEIKSINHIFSNQQRILRQRNIGRILIKRTEFTILIPANFEISTICITFATHFERNGTGECLINLHDANIYNKV
ncbi:hypothetical protein, partial [Prevotella sp.]|uniref:hypothetical protein n=1 Tax=Prevotella sp. TaxID=59823 RepID=UPI003FD8CE27